MTGVFVGGHIANPVEGTIEGRGVDHRGRVGRWGKNTSASVNHKPADPTPPGSSNQYPTPSLNGNKPVAIYPQT
eukprot:767778-Hanusia_phi.AAC.6